MKRTSVREGERGREGGSLTGFRVPWFKSKDVFHLWCRYSSCYLKFPTSLSLYLTQSLPPLLPTSPCPLPHHYLFSSLGLLMPQKYLVNRMRDQRPASSNSLLKWVVGCTSRTWGWRGRRLTAYRGFGHHGGDVLGPVEGDGAPDLDIGRVASRSERHHRGVMDDLLCFNLIGHVALHGGGVRQGGCISIFCPILFWLFLSIKSYFQYTQPHFCWLSNTWSHRPACVLHLAGMPRTVGSEHRLIIFPKKHACKPETVSPR